MTLRFGIECEMETGGSALFGSLNRRMGGVLGDGMHEYHCRCDVCEHSDGRSNPWTMQEDCTVSGEAISAILTWGTKAADDAIAMLAEALREARSQHGTDAGNHVHVDAARFYRTDEYGSKVPITVRWRRLQRIMHRYQDDELRRVAQGSFTEVRSYNSKLVPWWGRMREGARVGWPERVGAEDLPLWYAETADADSVRGMIEGGWLRPTGRTMEYRLWNSTRVEWRLRLHAGLSVAITNAAIRGADVEYNDPRPLAHVIRPYADDETMDLLARQLRYTA